MDRDCLETSTLLAPREALTILEPFFEELQEKFLTAGLAEVAKTKLRCQLGIHDTPRHFAGCLENGSIIYAAPELVELPHDTVFGILAHELGHAADFLYPGHFVLRGDKVAFTEKVDKHRFSGWQRRNSDDVEFSADLIAEWAVGTRIGYLGPCHLQSLGRGVPRPYGLR